MLTTLPTITGSSLRALLSSLLSQHAHTRQTRALTCPRGRPAASSASTCHGRGGEVPQGHNILPLARANIRIDQQIFEMLLQELTSFSFNKTSIIVEGEK